MITTFIAITPIMTLIKLFFNLLVFMVGIFYFLAFIKFHFFTGTRFRPKLREILKEEPTLKRKIDRLIFEMKPISIRKRKRFYIMSFLLINSAAFIFLGIFMFNYANYIAAAIACILFFYSPIYMFKYINEKLKE